MRGRPHPPNPAPHCAAPPPASSPFSSNTDSAAALDTTSASEEAAGRLCELSPPTLSPCMSGSKNSCPLPLLLLSPSEKWWACGCGGGCALAPWVFSAKCCGWPCSAAAAVAAAIAGDDEREGGSAAAAAAAEAGRPSSVCGLSPVSMPSMQAPSASATSGTKSEPNAPREAAPSSRCVRREVRLAGWLPRAVAAAALAGPVCACIAAAAAAAPPASGGLAWWE